MRRPRLRMEYGRAEKSFTFTNIRRGSMVGPDCRRSVLPPTLEGWTANQRPRTTRLTQSAPAQVGRAAIMFRTKTRSVPPAGADSLSRKEIIRSGKISVDHP